MSVVPQSTGKGSSAPAPAQQRGKTIATSALKVAERIAKLADETAAQTKKATEAAVSTGKTGLARAAEIGREGVLPEIEKTGAKLKARTRPERLKQEVALPEDGPGMKTLGIRKGPDRRAPVDGRMRPVARGQVGELGAPAKVL